MSSRPPTGGARQLVHRSPTSGIGPSTRRAAPARSARARDHEGLVHVQPRCSVGRDRQRAKHTPGEPIVTVGVLQRRQRRPGQPGREGRPRQLDDRPDPRPLVEADRHRHVLQERRPHPLRREARRLQRRRARSPTPCTVVGQTTTTVTVYTQDWTYELNDDSEWVPVKDGDEHVATYVRDLTAEEKAGCPTPPPTPTRRRSSRGRRSCRPASPRRTCRCRTCGCRTCGASADAAAEHR